MGLHNGSSIGILKSVARHMLTASCDGSVKVWDPKGECVLALGRAPLPTWDA